MWRFKFISPVKNLPFKDQMLHRRPPSYQNHLFVFIAFLLSRCQPACVNPMALHLLEESFFEKLQVMLKQGRRHRLHKNTENTNKQKMHRVLGKLQVMLQQRWRHRLHSSKDFTHQKDRSLCSQHLIWFLWFPLKENETKTIEELLETDWPGYSLDEQGQIDLPEKLIGVEKHFSWIYGNTTMSFHRCWNRGSGITLWTSVLNYRYANCCH